MLFRLDLQKKEVCSLKSERSGNYERLYINVFVQSLMSAHSVSDTWLEGGV